MKLCIIHKKVCIFFLFLGMFFVEPYTGKTEPKEILTTWDDIEVYDLNALTPFANPNAEQGGSIRLSAIGTYDNFNPYALRGRSPHYVFSTFEGLAEDLPGVSDAVRGQIAESFDLSDDRTKLKVKINPLARFSDGSKITSEDVVFTLNALKNESNPMYQMSLQDLVSVKATSDYDLEFEFSPEASREFPLEVVSLPVLSKKWWDGKKFGDPQTTTILASGPYTIKTSDFGVRLTLEKNKDYWAKDLPRNKGRYNFDEILVDYFKDATVAREAFFAGEIDYYSEGNVKDWLNAYNVRNVTNGNIIRKAFDRNIEVGSMGLVMNTRRPILSDINVRKALYTMMDSDWVNKNLYDNQYVITDSYFSGHPFKIEEKAVNVPPDIKEIWDKAEIKRTPAEWGMKWIFDKKAVSCALSGMNTLEQPEENAKVANEHEIRSLTSQEKELYEQARSALLAHSAIHCTGCKYCMPCGHGTDIPLVFSLYNQLIMFKDKDWVAKQYLTAIQNNEAPLKCRMCNKCARKCPQGIDVPKSLKLAHETLMQLTIEQED